MFTYFRAISLFVLLTATSVYGATSKIDGPADVFGPIEGSDVGFGNITATRLKLSHGTESALSLQLGDGVNGFYSNANNSFKVSITSTERGTFDAGGLHGWATNGPYVLLNEVASSNNPVFAFFGDTDTGFSKSGNDQPNIIAGAVEVFKGYTTYSEFYPTAGGALKINGGVYTAFRNLSSAAETLTITDHTIFCLANDNEVVATMPPCVGQSYSQQLMIIYTDSGSTNKCKLDGSGAETVAGFGVFSGLDTYEEGCHFVCDGSGNWWRAGCF